MARARPRAETPAPAAPANPAPADVAVFQRLDKENADLRREVAALKAQLKAAGSVTPPPAPPPPASPPAPKAPPAPAPKSAGFLRSWWEREL